MKSIQSLPDRILIAWHNSGKQLIFGNTRIAQFMEEENYKGVVTGLYHHDGLTLNSAQSAVHEFGHFVYYESNYPGLTNLVNKYYREYKDVIAQSVSAYAVTDEQEFFAECFEAYFRHGNTSLRINRMQEKMPQVYQLLKTMDDNNWFFD